jgi:CheY-like chemotaxis protein
MKHPQTILLVDDSNDDLFLMQRGFKKAEFEAAVNEVRNGEEAIEYLSGAGVYADRARYPYPTVVLLDLNMPLKNGFDVMAWIQSNAGGILQPFSVIILSASSRPEDVTQAFKLGAHAYLVKPSTLDDLVAMIRCLHQWLHYNHFPPFVGEVRK